MMWEPAHTAGCASGGPMGKTPSPHAALAAGAHAPPALSRKVSACASGTGSAEGMEIDAATPALPSRKHGLSRLPFPVTKRQRVGSVKSSLFMSPPSHIGSSAAAGATTPPPQSGLGASTPASAAGRWRVRGLRPRDLFDSDPSQPSITQYFRPKPVNMLRRLPALALDVVHEFLAPADLLRLNTLCRSIVVEPRAVLRSVGDAHFGCEEYLKFLLEAQERFRVLPYMSRQPHLKPIMRAILVDWLLDVGVLYHTLDSTLHLAVSCVDRFLQRRTITRDKFQLIGTAAMLIAMKHEETPGTVEDLAELTDNSFTPLQLRACEIDVFEQLDFTVHVPTVATFLKPLLALVDADETVQLWASYFADCALHATDCVGVLPSVLAAACLCMARAAAGRHAWSQRLFFALGVRRQAPQLRSACGILLQTAKFEGRMSRLAALTAKYPTIETRLLLERCAPAVADL